MTRLNFNGRMQEITSTLMDNVIKAYYLAKIKDFNPAAFENFNDPELMIFANGEHFRAKDFGTVFLADLEGLVIGLGAPDNRDKPEQVLPEWGIHSREFFDPEKNPFNYFQRMIIIKKALELTAKAKADPELDFERIDFIPKYPHHYFPSLEGLFESSEKIIQFLPIYEQKHWQRLMTKSPDQRNILTLYQDFRGILLSFIDHTSDLINEQQKRSFIVYKVGPNSSEFSSYDHFKIGNLISLCEDSTEAVVAVPIYSSEVYKRSQTLLKPLKPYDAYFQVKSVIPQFNPDWKKTHITFYFHEDEKRSEAFLPDLFEELE